MELYEFEEWLENNEPDAIDRLSGDKVASKPLLKWLGEYSVALKAIALEEKEAAGEEPIGVVDEDLDDDDDDLDDDEEEETEE